MAAERRFDTIGGFVTIGGKNSRISGGNVNEAKKHIDRSKRY